MVLHSFKRNTTVTNSKIVTGMSWNPGLFDRLVPIELFDWVVLEGNLRSYYQKTFACLHPNCCFRSTPF